MAVSEALKHKLELLPDSPGCYIMKDEKGEILYVGKAKVLKNRVRSYFRGVHDNKTTRLVARIRDFEFIETSTEKESLLLEINLIKKHRPPFNIMFMDDKMYPYIEVTPGADFAVRITRKPGSKKNDCFGPYPVSTYAYDMVKIINRLFPIRKCRTLQKSACLYYHMHQCLGYCFQKVDEQEALKTREKVIRFLKGNSDEILAELKRKMQEASENLQFERAGELLEEIRSVEYVMEKQTIDFSGQPNFDAFGWFEDKGYISIQGFFIREGKLLARNMSVTPIYEDTQDAFTAFILQYYQTNLVPRTIYVPEGTDTQALSEALNAKVMIPVRGEKKKLMDIVLKNAREAHEQKFQLIYKKDRELDGAVRKLSKIFRKPVHTVELFDNSHISGAYNVSGLVVFRDGKPDKNSYRRYQLSEYKGDTESMKEVTYRRYFRLLKEDKPMPDLLLVDGGIAQIHAAAEIKKELNLDLTIAGLVKDDRHTTRGLLTEEGEEVSLDKEDPLFFMLTRMQDEVHRFAIAYHRELRSKGMTKSVLDDIAGIGPARKKQINAKYPSMKKLRAATLEDLEQIVPPKSAAMLYARLHEQEKKVQPSVSSSQRVLEKMERELAGLEEAENRKLEDQAIREADPQMLPEPEKIEKSLPLHERTGNTGDVLEWVDDEE